jgi:hypothetical protein
VEGADDRVVGAESGVPADQRDQRLVDVDDVEFARADKSARSDDAARREGRKV